jgi:LuxR family maltose regulon positive regulatory protein
MKHRLTLVSAPAGFGKTTALSEWARQSEAPVAWLSLDEGDNDPTRFWAYFLAALQAIQADLDGDLLTSPDPSQSSTERILTRLINDAATASCDFALVLDDYHLIHAQPIHDALSFLLDHAPSQLHLFIASRASPPLPLSRLRARGQLIELHSRNLQFNSDECAAFLSKAMGLDLRAEDVLELKMRTEGWIAGLQLAGLYVQGQTDIRAFIESFTGDHRYIVDYLSQEVLQRQPESTRAFLLQTCILDQLHAPLCDATTGQDNGQEMLKRLEDANLFILPLDDARSWYRYHPLFSDFLRRCLKQSQPEQVPELHRRASAWYVRNGLIAQAVDHALAAGEFHRAASLIEEHARRFLFQAQIATLLGWMEALPDGIVRSRPRLSLYYGWVLGSSRFQFDAAEARLRDAERALGLGAVRTTSIRTREAARASGLGACEASRVLGELRIARAYIAELQGDMPRAITLAKEALTCLADHHVTTCSLAAWALGLAYRYSGDTEAASQAFFKALELSRAANFPGVTLVVLHNLAKVQMAQGRLRQGYATVREALQFADGHEVRGTPAMGHVYVGMAGLLYEWNRLDDTARFVREGITVGKLGGVPGIVQHGYVTMARVRQAQGDLDGALDTLREARTLVPLESATWYNAELATCQARLWVMQGDLEMAARWMGTRGLGTDDEVTYKHEPEHLTLARLLIAQGRRDGDDRLLHDAGRLLERLLRAAQSAGRIGSAIEILALQALALHAQGHTPKAIIPLERALSLAKPEGYVRVFVDEGPSMAELLHYAASRGLMPDYGRTLLAAFGDITPSPPETPALVEPLSDREIEVLQLLATRLSSQEIADELSISINTARTHIRNIYGKLDVHSRSEAAKRARALKLLHPWDRPPISDPPHLPWVDRLPHSIATTIPAQPIGY